MRFSHPEMFWFFSLIPLLVFGFVRRFGKRKQLLSRFAENDSAGRLSFSVSTDRRIFRDIFLIIAMVFLIFAAAGPQWGKELREFSRSGIDIMVALDTSRSMLAQDIQPSRLAKARREVENFLDRLKADRVGLIFFAGESFVQSPLTLDYSAIKMFLSIADPEVIPVPGTDIAGSVSLAVEAFKVSGKRTKVLVLMTDGETHTSGIEASVDSAAEAGVIIYTVGFGRTGGVPIPISDGDGQIIGYKRDKEGDPVLSSLNSSLLEDMSRKTGGKFFQASNAESELEVIAEEIDKMQKAKFKMKKGVKYKDRYPYPLAFAILFFLGYLLLNDRKKGY